MRQHPKAGILGLISELYEEPFPELKGDMAKFTRQIADRLKPVEVIFPGVSVRASEVEGAVRQFENEGADLIIVILLTYAPSLVSAPALIRTALPVVIFDTAKAASLGPDMTGDDLLENHGIHGVQDLANVLGRAGRRFHLVAGHWEDDRALGELSAWCRAAAVVSHLHRLRIGLLGHPFPGMGDFAIDDTTLRTVIGPEILPLSIQELADLAQAVSGDRIKQSVAEDRKQFEVAPELDEELHATSARWGLALADLVERHGLGALAMSFLAFGEDRQAETVPFLGVSKLMAQGIGYAGEGDVCCATLVTALAEMFGEATFTEMFCPDFQNGRIVMSHMGECNLNLARKDRPIQLIAKPFSFGEAKDPAVPAFSLQPGEVTLADLTVWKGGSLRLIATEAEVLDTTPFQHLVGPATMLKPQVPLEDFLVRYSLAGGTHHLGLAYGRQAHELEKLTSLLNIEFVKV